jgi:hypothetical protein
MQAYAGVSLGLNTVVLGYAVGVGYADGLKMSSA